MKLKIFTLRLNPATGLFDEGELVSFQLGKDVIEISEHFLVHEKTPTLLKERGAFSEKFSSSGKSGIKERV